MTKDPGSWGSGLGDVGVICWSLQPYRTAAGGGGQCLTANELPLGDNKSPTNLNLLGYGAGLKNEGMN